MEELKLRPLRVSIFSWIFCVSSACFKILFVVPFILSCHQKCIAAVCNLVLGPFWSLSPMIVNKFDIVFIYFFLFFAGQNLHFASRNAGGKAIFPHGMQLGKLFLAISRFTSENAIGKTIFDYQSFFFRDCNWENYCPCPKLRHSKSTQWNIIFKMHFQAYSI